MLSMLGWEGLCSVVAILAPVALLPMSAAAPPVGPGPMVRWRIHLLPSLVPQYRQTELFRQNFKSGAGDYMDQFLTHRKVNRLCWLAKCINIAARDSGMGGEGQ